MVKKEYDIKDYYIKDNRSNSGKDYNIRSKKNTSNSKAFVHATFNNARSGAKYIVIDNKRYYLNEHNSMETSNSTAILSIPKLKAGKSYDWNSKYRTPSTNVTTFKELEGAAKEQHKRSGNHIPEFSGTPDYQGNSVVKMKSKKEIYADKIRYREYEKRDKLEKKYRRELRKENPKMTKSQIEDKAYKKARAKLSSSWKRMANNYAKKGKIGSSGG